MIGFDVLVDVGVRIAMLRPHESDEEAVGLKRANIVTFTAEQYHLLLVLWEAYLENLGYHEENVISRGDLMDKITDYEVDMDSRRLNNSMELFRRYNLINFDPKDRSEEAAITLYPSLQFGWDLAQFQTVSAQYIREGNAEEEDEETESGDIIEEDYAFVPLSITLNYEDTMIEKEQQL
jgi:hypothetical protein